MGGRGRGAGPGVWRQLAEEEAEKDGNRKERKDRRQDRDNVMRIFSISVLF